MLQLPCPTKASLRSVIYLWFWWIESCADIWLTHRKFYGTFSRLPKQWIWSWTKPIIFGSGDLERSPRYWAFGIQGTVKSLPGSNGSFQFLEIMIMEDYFVGIRRKKRKPILKALKISTWWIGLEFVVESTLIIWKKTEKIGLIGVENWSSPDEFSQGNGIWRKQLQDGKNSVYHTFSVTWPFTLGRRNASTYSHVDLTLSLGLHTVFSSVLKFRVSLGVRFNIFTSNGLIFTRKAINICMWIADLDF